jgi:hypothetical protein
MSNVKYMGFGEVGAGFWLRASGQHRHATPSSTLEGGCDWAREAGSYRATESGG